MAAERVAVVGGGPAGATCARMLAASGARVDLFEARGDAEKPCGGGVPASALREFPVLADPALSRRVAREILILSPSERAARVTLPEGIHIFSRHDLDSHLRRMAGESGAVLHETRVGRVRTLPGGRWELLTQEGARGPYDRLVGADGVRGVVRRTLAGPWRDEDLTLALYAYLPGVPPEGEEMVLKFLGGIDGYLWSFPRAGHLSVGICARHRTVKPARLEEELRRFVEARFRLSAAEIRGYFIPASPAPPVAGQGTWALAGDAAGFVDPLTREGIAWAMRSGEAAARRGRTPDLPEELRWAHRFGPGFYRRDFLENMALLATASTAIRKVLADLFEGRQGYAGLRRRLLLNALPCGIQVGLRAAATVLKLRGARRIE